MVEALRVGLAVLVERRPVPLLPFAARHASGDDEEEVEGEKESARRVRWSSTALAVARGRSSMWW
jgi:hypothetical protein